MGLKEDIAQSFDEELTKKGVLTDGAFSATPENRYKPSKHAVDRARLRFGIETDKVETWVNSLMEDATYVGSQGDRRKIFEKDNVRLIVDVVNNVVITVHNAVSVKFLKPVIEREIRKMERAHTKLMRQIELDLALSIKKYAEMAVNKANARNPKTRELISERMDEVQAVIDGYKYRMERMEDDHKQRIRAAEMIAN